MVSRNRMLKWLGIVIILFTVLSPAGAALGEIIVEVDSLSYEGQAVVANLSRPIPVFGINVQATAGEGSPPRYALIQKIEVDVFDDGLTLGPPDADADVIAPSDFAGFFVYRDDGTVPGEFDDDDSIFGPAATIVSPPVRVGPGLVFTAEISGLSLPIPNNDLSPNEGYDYFVVFRPGALTAEDDFFLRLPADTIRVTLNNPIQSFTYPGAYVDTHLITAVESPEAKVTITSLPKAGQGILPRSGPTEIFGINASSPEGQIMFLSEVTVRIDNVGETPLDGLEEVTVSDFLVFQIYRDGLCEPAARNGIFDPPGGEFIPDDLVAEVEFPFGYAFDAVAPFWVTITVPSPELNFYALIPSADADAYAGSDFFVVLRTSDTIDSDFYVEGFSFVDDFTCAIEPLSVRLVSFDGGTAEFPDENTDDIETPTIVTEALALDLQPLPMDRQDARTEFNVYPGICFDLPDGDFRYHYGVLGQNLRWRFFGERDREFTGISENTTERYISKFEQPVVATVERRHDIIGLDVAGGTTDNPEYLTGLTLTFSNLGAYLETLRDFDPSFGVDRILAMETNLQRLVFSGINVYEDTNNNGVFDEGVDQPLIFDIVHSPGFIADAYNVNIDKSHYMLQIYFLEPLPEIDLLADEKSDFFVVTRLDSGKADDSNTAGDGTSINFGADFKISLEIAEAWAGIDFNGDDLIQPNPVQFQYADPRAGLTIVADSSVAPFLPLREVRKTEAIIAGQDLAQDHGYDLPNDPGFTSKIVQRVDATSPPVALLGLNAASTTVELDRYDDPYNMAHITEIRLNFSGDGFEPSDLAEVLLVRDDKSPWNALGGRSVGVFDVFNDLWNNPPPGSAWGVQNNPDDESPIRVTPWTWQNDGLVDYVVFTPAVANIVHVYPHDDIEADASVSNFSDNFEIIHSPINPSLTLPRDKVFTGADYFIVIQTSDSISYDDEIKLEIPRGGLAIDHGLTVFEGVDLFNPEDRDSETRSVRANVPVKLNDLVASGQEIWPNSGHVAVLGFNMYTNRPPASQGGVDVYFEQLVIAFLQYGTRDSLNIASDLVPFENINGPQTVNSGIQLYRDANGNGRFDGPGIDTLVQMDNTTTSLGPNPSRVGLLGDEPNQVLMVFSSTENRQLVPSTDTGSDLGDDFFLVIRTSATFDMFEDNFSVAVISWGPDSPFAPAPHTINAWGNRPYDAIAYLQAHPWGRRGIGLVDSNGIRTRSTETINTNTFNATLVTMLDPVENFSGAFTTPVTDPTHQVVLTWVDTNSDNASTQYVNENESGHWIESDIYGDFQPLPNSNLAADTTQFFFDGPVFLAGKTVRFRIMPYRSNIGGNPLYPPFNGPGPVATTSVTFWPSPRPEPFALFYANPASGCAPLSVQFVNNSLQGTTWSWNFGDGSALSGEKNPIHIFTQSGTFEVCLTATNTWGSDTACRTITVNSAPVAEFTTNSRYACINQPVQFMDTSTGNAHTYAWNFGDGGTSSFANPTHSYASIGMYTVTLTVSNDCGSDTETKTSFISVTTGLNADFSYSPVDGCAPVTIQFVDGSTCEAIEWEWDFGDGSATSNQQNPTHLYESTGTYNVCLTARNASSSQTTCKDVTIYSCIPAISLSVTSLNPSCNQGANASQQTFTVRNSGIGVLNYSIYDNAYWLSCSPTSGFSSGDTQTITVTYSTAGMAPGIYNGTITVSAAGSANSPQYINVTLQVGSFPLSKINLVGPASGATVASAPTFSWKTNGGSRNAFSVEIAFTPYGPWRSTYVDLKEIVYGTSYAMPSASWSKIQSGKKVYWRVRGRDLDVEPAKIITSAEVWHFYKK